MVGGTAAGVEGHNLRKFASTLTLASSESCSGKVFFPLFYPFNSIHPSHLSNGLGRRPVILTRVGVGGIRCWQQQGSGCLVEGRRK